jgi:ppGpp synthetase/RelA/SpoT-type nucleotidyltranferase
LGELQEFRALYALPLQKAQALIKERLGYNATARLKTANTTVEKLRRETIRLSQIQDIAGLRLVGDWFLTEQDMVVREIVEVFERARVHDRRSKPSQGYRAMHVISIVDQRPIEIQIRTLQQDGWAQAMEKLADAVGRQVRYGGAPIRGGESAAMAVRRLMNFSNKIAEFEALRNSVWGVKEDMAFLRAEVQQLPADDAKELERWLERMVAKIPEVEAREEEVSGELRAILATMPKLHAILQDEGTEQ